MWNCCRWHGRKERRNTACQGRVPYFKLLPLPGNKYASLQNNNYKAWEKIQGTQNPSVGVGVLADARLGVFGGNVIPAGHGSAWSCAVIENGENVFPVALHPKDASCPCCNQPRKTSRKGNRILKSTEQQLPSLCPASGLPRDGHGAWHAGNSGTGWAGCSLTGGKCHCLRVLGISWSQ